MKRHSFFVSVLASTFLAAAWPTGAAEDLKAPEERPVNALAKLAAGDPNVRADMAKRFARFMLDGDGGKASYVAAEARKGDMAKRLEAMPKAWVEKVFKDAAEAKKDETAKKDKAASAVKLYFVLGEEKAPAWAASAPELKDSLTGFRREQLISNMKPWTGEADAKQGDNPGVKAGPLAKPDGNLADWVYRFLDSAAETARLIMDAATIPKDKKPGLIGEIEEKSPVMGGIGTKRRMGASAGYGDEDLFVGGARTMLIYQEGDQTSREISVKMISYKTDNGVINQVGICDITYPEDKFCRRFAIKNSGGDETFALDDRKPGQRQYTLKFKTDETGVHLAFGRPKAVAGGAGAVIETSVADLAELRAQHVVDMNRVVVINGVEFLVAGQTAGTTGEHLYYRKDRLESGGAMADRTPEFVAEVVSLKGGVSVIARHKVGLGKVKDKEYHTYYDPEERKFKIGEGPGEAPKPPGTSTGTTDPGTTNPGTPPSGFDPIEDEFLNVGYYAPNREVNAAIKPEGLLRIHDATEKGVKWLKNHEKEEIRNTWWARLHILFIPGVTKKALYVKFEPNEKGQFVEDNQPIRVIMDSRYLLSVSDGGLQFRNLKAKPDPENGFPAAGRVKTPSGGPKSIEMIDVSDAVAVKLLLGEVLGKEDVENAFKSLTEVSKNRKLENVQGTASSLVAKFKEGPNVKFWPLPVIVAPETGGGFPNVTGKGETIFEKASGGPPADFSDAPEVGTADNLEKLKVYNGLKKKNAVLYVNAVEKGKGSEEKPRKWYIQFNFKNFANTPNNPNQDYRSAFIPLPISEGGKGTQFPYEAKTPVGRKPDGAVLYSDVDINEDGLTILTEGQKKLDLMTSGTHGRVVATPAPTKEKGVYAVFTNRAQDARDDAEKCLGPIFWWGMDKKAAWDACKADKY
ncbi:MAG: hypothetical protein HY748_04650 [Elusimicrobia bacterium]|nr:hypothetical protein [Elusimicrobiota bacterium]